ILPFDDSESILSDSTVTDDEKINAYEYLSIENMSHSIDITNEEIVINIIKNKLDKEIESEPKLISSSTKEIYNIQNIVQFVKYKQTDLELDNKHLKTLYEI
ncbi:22546_t:CDS:2, partial [Cetraspora pellucida]